MINPINGINTTNVNHDDTAQSLQDMKDLLIQIIIAAMSGEDFEIVTTKDAQGHPHEKLVIKPKHGETLSNHKQI